MANENASAIPAIAAYSRQPPRRNTPPGWQSDRTHTPDVIPRRRSQRNPTRAGLHSYRPPSSLEHVPYVPFVQAEYASRSSRRGTPPPYREPQQRQLPHEHQIKYSFQGEYIIVSVRSSHPIIWVDADTIAHNFQLEIHAGERGPDREDASDIHREAQGHPQNL